MTSKQTGTVKWFTTVKGYGFIVPDVAGPDVFVHIKDVQGSALVDVQGMVDKRRVAFVTSGEGQRNGKILAKELEFI